MRTSKKLRKIAMLLSLLMLITSTVGTTYCYIVTKTNPLTNVFIPGTAGVSGLAISKTVEHPLGDDYAIPENISFDFDVELGSYYQGAKLNTTSGKMTAGENGTLSISIRPGATFGILGLEEGTVVKVTEKTPILDGFAIKDEAIKTVTVGADGTASISFVNTYSPDVVKPGNVTVGGVKVLEGREWQKGDSFSFVLEQKKGDNWTKLGEQTVTNEADNDGLGRFDFSSVFKTLTFDKVGIYSFRMSEIKGALEDVFYDETVNHFTVKVTDVDMDGKLEINTVEGAENAAVTKTNDGYAVSVTFNNTFVPSVLPDPDPITVQIGIDKIVNNLGEAICGKEDFQFVLKNVATAEGLCATSDSNGKASFSLTFSKADIGKTHTYKLSETDQGVEGMTYDADVHEITITVSLNENNELVAALTMDGKSVDVLNATFENNYDADSSETPPTGVSSNLTIWLILMIVSGSALVALVVYDRKSRRV